MCPIADPTSSNGLSPHWAFWFSWLSLKQKQYTAIHMSQLTSLGIHFRDLHYNPGYPLQRSSWQWYICTGLSANGINHLGVFFSHSLCLLEVKLSLKLSFGLTDIGECLQGDLFCIARFGECPMCPLTTVQTSSEDWIPSLWCGCWEFIMFPRICFFICRFFTIQKLSELLQVELLARNSPFLSFSLQT